MKREHTEPISHPSAWTAAGLAGRPGWSQTLDPSERDELLGLIGDDGGWRGREVESLEAGEVPVSCLRPRLDRIAAELEDGAGAVRLRGLPEGLDATRGRRLLWILSVHLGTPVSQSAAGEKIFSVRDAGYGMDDPRSRGPNTRRRLSFHTDRADVTGFLCLRQARRGGENDIASSVSVYNEILRRRPDVVSVLMQPFYYLRHTVDEGNSSPWCRQPVFSFAGGHFACCYLRVLIERAHREDDLPDLDPREIEAMDYLERVAEEEDMHLRFRQEPGDLVLINNWTVLHRRSEFVDHRTEDLRRHILRVWLSMPNSRPIDEVFRDNWGAVEAGAVRGGMRPND